MQMARLVHRNSVPDDQSDAGGDSTEVRALESGSGESQALVLQTLTDSDMDSDNQMTLAIPTQSDLDTPPVPIEYDTTDPLETHWQALPAPPAAPSPPMPSSADTQMQVHSQPDESIPVNESIISLLLKLHSQLSGRLDSFSLEEPAPASQEPIGDGPYFIGQVLRKLAALDARCAAAVQHVRRTLWPHQRERQAEQRARERREKEERSRRARERQQAVMREFARRQQQFLSAMRAEAGDAMDWEDEQPARDYDCVICNTTAPATHHDPIGL
ncbi:PREDICTED: E3 ubiquitin-protein ligase UBR3-like, partial [Papilio xuthus]